MSNNENHACNPSLLNIVTGDNYTVPSANDPAQTSAQVLDFPSIVSLILWLLLILYSSFSSASKGSKLINMNGNRESTTAFSDIEGENGKKTYDDEQESVQYSYSGCHFVFFLAT